MVRRNNGMLTKVIHYIEYFKIQRLTQGDTDVIMKELKTDFSKHINPHEMLEKLDTQIVSQSQAKRQVVKAIRNKFRMQNL